MGGGAYRAAAEAAAALERAARGLAEELQCFERAEVVARDAAPQARRAVVAVRPRPLRLRNDEALARRARPLLGRRRGLVAPGLARRGVVVLVAGALRPQGPQHVVERAEGAGERLRGDLGRAVGRRRSRSGLRGPGAPSPAASIFLKYFWAWLRIWAAVLVVMRSATFFHSRP